MIDLLGCCYFRRLQSLLISVAVSYGDENTVKEATDRFNKWMQNTDKYVHVLMQFREYCGFINFPGHQFSIVNLVKISFKNM